MSDRVNKMNTTSMCHDAVELIKCHSNVSIDLTNS